ncbi:MAG: hypothetical protein PHW77_08475 [Eubacteriales bacterium]|nr:hypothetical protein [Eubacteriales bacterium]
MRVKIFTLIMSVIVILLTIVSCVSLPIENESDPSLSKSESNSTSDNISEPNSSQDESPDGSSEESPDSTEPSSDDSSDEDSSEDESSDDESSADESSQISLQLPYETLDGITFSTLTSSVYDEYFTDSIFIGNSIMVHFYNFYSQKRSKYPGFLGGSKFFASSNFSSLEDSKAVSDGSWHPKYGGTKMNSADAVAESGVSTVYLSVMALNEIALHNTATCVDDTFNTTINLINSIKAKSPNVNIVILSNTYMVYNHNSYGRLNNGNISALNNKMLEYCNTNGLDFIDVSTFLMNGNVLADKYCTDYQVGEGYNGCHLTNDAYSLWTATLRNYAYLKQNNAWTNPEFMPSYTKNQ